MTVIPCAARRLRLVGSCVALLATGSTMVLEAQGPRPGGTLAYGERPPEVGDLHPYLDFARTGATFRVLSMLLEPLFRFRFGRDEWEPVLATGYREVAPRNPRARSAFEVTLREATWHDGTRFTPSDVIFSYRFLKERAVDPGLRAQYRTLLVDVRPGREGTTVVFEFSQDLSDPREYLQQFIIPAARFDWDTFAPVGQRSFAAAPLGTGPFAFEAYDLGRPRLRRYPAYHTAPAPFLERVHYNYFPDNATLVATLESNDIQLVVDVPPTELTRIEASASLKTVPLPSFNAYAIAMRQRPDSPLNDQRVRRAITMAIDRQQLLQNWFGGNGAVLASPVTAQSPYFNPDVRPLPHDPAQARALIQAAGAGGRPLRFIYPSSGGADTRVKDIVTAIVTQLRAVGLTVVEKPLTLAEWGRTLRTTGDFDLSYYRWEFTAAYDITPVFRTPASSSGEYNQNFLGYSSREFDRLADLFLRTEDDTHRINLAKDMQRLLNEEAPAVFLVSETQTFAYNPRLVIPPESVDQLRFFTYARQWYYRGVGR